MNRNLFKVLAIPLALLGVSVLLVVGAPGVKAGYSLGADSLVAQSVPVQAQAQTGGQGKSLGPLTEVGTAFTYHGQLKQNGSPANGQFDFRFRLFDAASGGNLVGSPIQVLSQTVSNGLVAVSLDFGAEAFQGSGRWLQIDVRPAGVPPYTVLSPRQPLTAAPYAMSLVPGAVISSTSASPVLSVTTATGTGLYGSSTDGSGVYGSSNATAGGGAGVYGVNNSTWYGRGVWGASDCANCSGVYGTSSSGRGVYGLADCATCYGVEGSSDDGSGVRGSSTYGYGVYGTSITSAGVRGHSNTGSGVYGTSNGSLFNSGVYGLANCVSCRGVFGYSTNGTGMYGSSEASSQGVGAYGISDCGTCSGVEGYSDNGSGVRGLSVDGYGVYGSSSGFWGVRGSSTASTGGIGVHGSSACASCRGVYGTSTDGDGIYGFSSNGWAGYFNGDVQVTGSCCGAGAGSYKIDHPLDPEKKYLYHSVVQSQEMKNIYDGVAVLDAKGEAWVQLPDWFEALNRDFRYQFAPIGAPMPDLYIAQEIQGNHFKIAGGKAGLKVSWMVTGIRKDPYASAHPIPVEQGKPKEEQGKYLHPKEWGVPESKGVDYEETKRLQEEEQEQKHEGEQEHNEPANRDR